MEQKENFLNSHFDEKLEEQERVIEYLNKSFVDAEIFSLGRLIDIDKNDYYAKGMRKQEICEAFIERVQQKSMFDRLFVHLLSPKYFRLRLVDYFQDLGIKPPITKEKAVEITKQAFTMNLVPDIKNDDYNDWIHSCRDKTVLILGKDSTPEWWERLQGIANMIREHGYVPMLIKEQPEITAAFNEEKMLVYACLSKFIIIEKSEAAGQIVEAKICADNRFVSAWLQLEGQGDTWMQADYEQSYNHVKVFKYTPTTLPQTIEDAVRWAEKTISDKAHNLNDFYPWRNK